MARFKRLDDRMSESSKARLRQAGLALRAMAARWAMALRHTVRVAVATVGLMVLTGCETPHIKGLCPSYVHYSARDDQAVLAELRTAEDAGHSVPTTHRYLRDYGKQRAALRVICKGN